MTRSSFDPRGGQTERSGSRNLGPDAQNNSHMPPDLTQAEVENVEKAEKDIEGGTEEIQQYRFRPKRRKGNPKK